MYVTPKTLYNSPTVTWIIHKAKCFDELVEALKDMVESYQYEAHSENPALLKAKAAITKATGEQV